MRRAFVIGSLSVCACAFGFAFACGIAENGLLDAGGAADVSVPEACASLDASCLGPLPKMWQPVAIGNGSCDADWNGVTLVTNPRVLAGGCACGACVETTPLACEAGVPISGGDGCGDDPFATAAPGACTNVNATQHLLAHAITANGSPACAAPNDAGAGATTDSVFVCVPGCTADFCGGSSRCAMAEGEVACPSGYTLYAHAGTAANPGCAPCSCEAGAPGTCSGTVTAFLGSGCSATDDAGTFAVETCNEIDDQYRSVFVSLAPPDASCTLTTPTITGDASLIGTMTICCQ
jgi:hypothetical protein